MAGMPQIADGSNVQIASPGMPGSTFAGAPKPIIDNNMGQLATSLGAFSQSLGNLGQVMMYQQKQDAGAAFSQWQGTTKRDDQVAAMKDNPGSIPLATTDRNLYVTQVHGLGVTAAQQVLDTFKGGIGTSFDPLARDPTSGNYLSLDPQYTQFANQNQAEYLKNFAKTGASQNPLFSDAWIKGFNDTIASGRKDILGIQQEKQTADTANLMQNGARTFAATALNGNTGSGGVVSAILNKKAGVEDAMQALYQAGVNIKKIAPGITNKQIEDQQLSAIDDLIKSPTTAPVALAILTAGRKDITSGGDFPSFAANNPEATKMALAALDKSREGEKQSKLNELVDQALAASSKGDILGFNNVAGQDTIFTSQYKLNPADAPAPTTITKEQIQAQYAQKLKEKWAGSGKANTANSSYGYAGELASMNIPDESLKGRLNGITSLTTESMQTNPQLRDQAIDMAEQYDNLKKANPGYSSNTLGLSKGAIDLYDTYGILKDLGRMDPRAAMDAAISATKVDYQTAQYEITRRETDKIKSALSTGWGMWTDKYFGFFNGVATNQYGLRDDLVRLSTALLRAGQGDPDKVIDTAIQYMKDPKNGRGILINGHWLPSSTNLPPAKFKDAVEAELGDFAQKFGKMFPTNSDNPGDLSIHTVDGGKTYAVINANTGMPMYVPGADGHSVPAMLSIDDIMNRNTMFENAAKQKILNNNKTNIEDSILAIPAMIPKPNLGAPKKPSNGTQKIWTPEEMMPNPDYTPEIANQQSQIKAQRAIEKEAEHKKNMDAIYAKKRPGK